MGQTKKRNYDRYTLGFKLQAVRLANHPNVIAKDVAESLGIHPVMLYRWQMEHRNGELTGEPPLESRRARSFSIRSDLVDLAAANDAELVKAKKRIKELERALDNRTEEIDLLKKAQRFFEKTKR